MTIGPVENSGAGRGEVMVPTTPITCISEDLI
jgi:hypothetical protein